MRSAYIVISPFLRIDCYQHVIGTHSIPHVRPSSKGIQIACIYYRGEMAGFYESNLLGKGGFGKNVAAPGACMGEHAGGHHRHVVGFRIIAAQKIGAHFGNGVR